MQFMRDIVLAFVLVFTLPIWLPYILLSNRYFKFKVRRKSVEASLWGEIIDPRTEKYH